jgi:hypothetical protein
MTIGRIGIKLFDGDTRELIMKIDYKFLANFENENNDMILTIYNSEIDVGVGQDTEMYPFGSSHVRDQAIFI